jgi:hypothetical protein
MSEKVRRENEDSEVGDGHRHRHAVQSDIVDNSSSTTSKGILSKN